MSLTPAQRVLRSRIANGVQKSAPTYDGSTATQSARQAYWTRYYDHVDPNRQLTPYQRDRKAKAAWQADMARARFYKSKQGRS